MKLRDTLWIWGQDAGSHHHTAQGNIWDLPGENRMGPVEGCRYLGIPNCCRVVMNGLPTPPFDGEADKLDCLRRVVWSIIGDSGSARNNEETDLEEVLRIAQRHQNVSGAIMDDFMSEERMERFPPERLGRMRHRLHTAIPGKPLELWTVLYYHEVSEAMMPWLQHVDRITLWAWRTEELRQMDEVYARLDNLTAGAPKPVLAGCYFYDYGNCKPMSADTMQLQLEYYYKRLHEGRLDGIVFCSNAVADLGLEAVRCARDWIAQYGDEELSDRWAGGDP